MNRRLVDKEDIRPPKRYRTADTKISNSRKLPSDFFSNNNKKSICLSLSLSQQNKSESLPSLKRSLEKSRSI